MTTQEKLARRKLSLLELAKDLGNVSNCLENPSQGPLRVAQQLALKGISVSSGGVRRVWSRHGLLTMYERLLRLEKTMQEKTIVLTAEQVRLLERFNPEFRDRHIEANHTGDLVAGILSWLAP